MHVLEFPPSDSRNKEVNFDSRYGGRLFEPAAADNAETTRESVTNESPIAIGSF
jgi:hypothetical protein